MVEYQENRIILSGKDSEVFQRKMNHPNTEVMNRRDYNLNWIEQHMDIHFTETGFVVTVDTEK